MFTLTEKDVSVQIKLDGKNSVVHVLYPSNMSSTNNALVQFPSVTLKPGKLSISIYNSDTDVAEPTVTLGQFDRLPLAIPSNTPSMRIVYSGIAQVLNVTYRSVDSNSNCQLLSPFSSTFEVHGGQSNTSPCSWYIPESKSNVTVINPTILKIPQGKVLTVTTFSAGGSKVDSYPG